MSEEDPKAFKFRIRQSEHPDDIEKQALSDSINNVESKLNEMSLNFALSSTASSELAKKVNYSIKPVDSNEAHVDRLIEKGIRDLVSTPINTESDIAQKARKMKKQDE